MILGVGNSLLSFARMISPALGGVAQEASVYAPGSIGALIAGTSTRQTHREYRQEKRLVIILQGNFNY